jgi:hypothetical protein
MAKKVANVNDVYKFFEKLIDKKISNIKLDDALPGADKVELSFFRSLTKTQKDKIFSGVLALLEENFIGSYKLDDFKFSDGESVLKIKVVQFGSAPSVPTNIQEEGSAYIMTRVLEKNKKFSSAADILSDTETRNGLEKIFGSSNKGKINEWVHSSFEHQKAFFEKFQPPQWDIFEHGGQDLMGFIQKQCALVTTDTGEKVGNYTTWNPADIWVVKNKSQVVKKIDKAIQKDGTAKLVELNNILLEMIQDNKLIGLSLKKVKDNQSAKFKYVNMDSKKIEFASVEKIKFKDIKFEIDFTIKNDSIQQGSYVLFGNYTINILRTPTQNDTFSNLKFESVIKNSGGRGGAAPVDLVSKMLSSNKIDFKNRHQDYPKNAPEFSNTSQNYEKMYRFLKSKINIKEDKGYENFKDAILSMYRSGNDKKKAVAQSKLMQLAFFYECLNSVKGKTAEFWTDLFYLSIKRNISVIGNRFAPHGKLDVKQ